MTRVEGQYKILIVDDEQDLTGSLMAIFLEHGYDARIADSAEQASEILAAWVPDLALIDVALPHMNGIDLAIAMRKAQPGCRLVLFSGEQTSEALLEEAAVKGNIFEFLAKPVHPLFMLDYVASRLAARPSRNLAT